MIQERLSKVLSQSGIASRRKAEDLIFAGAVTVNGKTILLPQTKVNPNKDHIEVYKTPIKKEKKVYYLFHKPKGYICSHLENRKTIYRFFGHEEKRLFSIGRLDKDTEGLLILTNDGEFANKVIHPSSDIPKEYIVKTNKEILDHHLKTIAKGTVVEGKFVKPKKVEKVRKGTVKVVVHEGKKHEVRKLVAAAELEIYELKRTRIGSLRLGTLPKGSFRNMTEKEKLSVFA